MVDPEIEKDMEKGGEIEGCDDANANGKRSLKNVANHLDSFEDEELHIHSAASVFDVNKFLTSSPLPDSVVEEAKSMIYQQIEEPLRRLEQRGLDALVKYQRDNRRRKKKIVEATEKEARTLQNNLNDLLIRGNPREYQQRLFEIAIQKNTIVNLGTGTGKTLIALLCIKEKMKVAHPGKKQTLFLVPSVALAIQQSLTLKANLPSFKVDTAYYATPSSKRTRSDLVNCDVIVATHGAMLDLLMHWGDLFSLTRVNLIVIDECHYASGSHPYRHLMTKFYHPLEPKDRPHILGLTASPLVSFSEHHSDEQISGLLDKLEQTLDATLISASGLLDCNDFSQWHSRAIKEEVVLYHGTNTGRGIPSAKNHELLPSRYREFKQLEHMYTELGPLVVREYCKVLRREISQNYFESESTTQYDEAMKYLNRVIEFCEQEILTLPAMGRTDKLLALEALLDNLIEQDDDEGTIGVVFVERRITALALHVYLLWKRDMLHQGINWLAPEEARCFLAKSEMFRMSESQDNFEDSPDDPFHKFQEKQAALQMMDPAREDRKRKVDSITATGCEESVFASNPGNKGPYEHRTAAIRTMDAKSRIRSTALVRSPTHVFKSLSIQQKNLTGASRTKVEANWIHKEPNLREVLSDLRNGRINLLFATSVVEEGVDVQACSFVIAFDGLGSVKGYIQMKGRARQKHARFYLFQDSQIRNRNYLELSVAREMESRVSRIVEQRMNMNESTVKPNLAPLAEDEEMPAVSSSNEVAAVEAGVYRLGEAIVDMPSAKPLLHRYYASVPIEPLVRRKKELLLAYLPNFDENKLELPSHLPRTIRTITLPDQYKNCSRKEKESILSLMACVRLHSHGLLNDRLLPLSRKDMQERMLSMLAVEHKMVTGIPERPSQFYENEYATLQVYPVIQEGTILSQYATRLKGEDHHLGLVTVKPLHDIDPITLVHKDFGPVTISLGEPFALRCSKEECEIMKQTFVLLFNSRWNRKSRGIFYRHRTDGEYSAPIAPYFLAILKGTHSLDWELMKKLIKESERTPVQRTDAVGQWSDESSSPPRVITTTYNEYRQFVLIGPTGKTCGIPCPYEVAGVKTYKDFFDQKYGLQIQEDEPLYDAQPIWEFHSGLCLSKNSATANKRTLQRKSIFLPLSCCVEASLANAYICLLCVFLPQTLFCFERQQIVQAFVDHCEKSLPILGSFCKQLSKEKLITTITAKSCSQDDNYDKWEWVGDAVLKLMHSDSLLKSQRLKEFVDFLHEGDLSVLRSELGRNEKLGQVCVSLGLERFIMTVPLSRGKWIASPLILLEAGRESNRFEIQRKTTADVIEALLGVIYLEFGYDACMKIGHELGLSVLWEDFSSISQSHETDIGKVLDVVRSCTNYDSIRNPYLFEQAFTHPSAINTTVSSYQRLEWIGDAVICLCARDWLYRKCPETTDLKNLVLLEDALVSNETHGVLSMRYGLPHFLNHRDQALPHRIETYFMRVETGGTIWRTDPPKPVSDLVESVVGAVHMDGGFAAGQAAATRMFASVFATFSRALKDNKLDPLVAQLTHPKRALQEITGKLLDLVVCNDAFNSTDARSATPVLYKDRWSRVKKGNASQVVSAIKILDTVLIAATDESSTVSKALSSSLVVKAFRDNSELLQRIAACQSKIAKAATESNKRTIGEDDESTTSSEETA